MLRQILLTLSIVASFPAYADVYEYIDDEGDVSFTDSPRDNRYVLILKTEDALLTNLDSPEHAQLETKSNKNEVVVRPLTSPQIMEQIEASAHNNQLDSELVHAVIYVESAYKANALSHKGAQGLMQLMPATAKRFGVNNSRDPAQNIEGGAKYLRELLNLFKNDVSLAVAAYNAGENAVIKYGNKIPPYKETQAYVPKVLSVYKALLKQRQQLM